MQWLLVLPPLLLLAFATALRSGESARPVCADSSAPCPHLVTLLADDLGWYDTTINNPDAPTPQISALLAEGFRLERHYVYRYCSPTRRSMLSGRWPAHITGKQAPPCSNFLPLSCALLSEKLKLANYSSIFVGKGHLGWLTEDHLMVNRGFSSHLGYLAGAESYAYGVSGEQPDLLQHAAHEHDMWLDHEPAWAVSTEIDYSPTFYSKWVAQKLHSHVATRPTQPMWLHFPVQNVHAPYVLSPAAVRRDFPTQQWNDHQELRSIYMNMLALLDDMVGNVTASLRKEEMWANTLMLVNSHPTLPTQLTLHSRCSQPFQFSRQLLTLTVATASSVDNRSRPTTGGSTWATITAYEGTSTTHGTAAPVQQRFSPAGSFPRICVEAALAISTCTSAIGLPRSAVSGARTQPPCPNGHNSTRIVQYTQQR